MIARATDAAIACGGMKVLPCVRDVPITRIQDRRRVEADND